MVDFYSVWGTFELQHVLQKIKKLNLARIYRQYFPQIDKYLFQKVSSNFLKTILASGGERMLPLKFRSTFKQRCQLWMFHVRDIIKYHLNFKLGTIFERRKSYSSSLIWKLYHAFIFHWIHAISGPIRLRILRVKGHVKENQVQFLKHFFSFHFGNLPFPVCAKYFQALPGKRQFWFITETTPLW